MSVCEPHYEHERKLASEKQPQTFDEIALTTICATSFIQRLKSFKHIFEVIFTAFNNSLIIHKEITKEI